MFENTEPSLDSEMDLDDLDEISAEPIPSEIDDVGVYEKDDSDEDNNWDGFDEE